MPVEAKRAQAIFLAAVEQTDPAARTVILDRECGGDPELRQRVEALLRAYSAPDSMLDAAPVVEAETPGSEVTQAIDSATPQPGDAASVNDKLRDLGFLKPATKPGSIGRIDQYEILEVIGQGGFGTVFKAFDDKLHRVVAIKVLSPAFAANGAARKRFIREARTAAAIKNEHVVAIYDVDEDAQPPYLAMEMIDGMSLQDKLDKHGPLGLKEILRIGLQMAEGLTAAHKQSLVHRDIKPANILLENGVERVKITDFGLARAVDDASVTQSGTVAGTPMYMSPEQAEGVPIDHRSDLFSLGTVLYAMCTGHPPFRATGTHAVLKRVIEASPRPIREINDDIPQWLCDIIAKLHAKKPEDRYASAKDVAEVLGARLADVQAGRAIGMPAGGTAKPRSSSSRGLFKWTAALLCVAAIVCAAAAAVNWFLPVPELPSVPNTSIVVYNDDPELQIELQAAWETRPTYRGFPGVTAITFGSVNPGEWEIRGYKDHKLIRRDRFVLANQETRKIRWDRPDEAFLPLFNGKDLAGWDPQKGREYWRVVDNVLTGTAQSGLILMPTVRKDYANFHLRVQARVKGPGNSGILFRGQYQAEIEATRYTGGIALNQPFKWLDEKPHTLVKPNEWFTLEIIANGPRLRTTVNGIPLADVTDTTAASGGFALELNAQNGPVGVDFKKIEIKELPPEEPSWVQLFNGQDTTGWIVPPPGTGNGDWHVDKELGQLVGRGPDLSYVLTERDDFTDFHLKTEVSCTGGTDSGVFFRCGKDLVHGKFPVGYEANAGFELPFNTGALLLTTSESKTPLGLFNPPFGATMAQFHQFEIIARDNRIVIKIDGKTVTDYTDVKASHRKGRIALQVSSSKGRGAVAFKKIEIKRLPSEDPPVVEEPGWTPLCNGKDLAGWGETIGKGNWKVVNGVLTGSLNGDADKVSRLRLVQKEFSNFHLRSDVRLSGPGNSGIRFRDLGSHYRLVLAEKTNGSIESLLKSPRWLQLTNGPFEEGKWFKLDLSADGTKLACLIDGNPVASVDDSALTRGGLELMLAATPGPVTVQFKNLRIKELAPTAPRAVIAGTPKLRKSIDLNRRVSYLAFGADSNTLIVGGSKLTFLDTVTGDVIHEENLPGDIHTPLAFSKDRRTLATSYKENVLILDLPVRKVPFQSKSGYAFSVALSPDGKTLVYAADKSLFFYDRGTRKLSEENRYHRLISLKWSLDGNYLIGVWAKELTILDATTRELIARKPIGVMGLTDISPDSKRIAVTGMEADKFAFFIYGMPGHRLEYKETSLDSAPVSVAFSPDGTYLALGLLDGKAEIWDLVERKRVASWLPARYEKAYPTGVAFSPDGKTLATGGNTSVQLWDLADNKAD